MIAVIADDFSGAAELAGICLRFGLTVQLCIRDIPETAADVLIVSTDSRSMTRAAAMAVTSAICSKIIALQPSMVFKKTDSVLRGYVVDELHIQMDLMEKNAAILLPANPSLGRTIQNSLYYIDGKRIDTTSFANDPEFPIKDANIALMCKDSAIKVRKHSDTLLEEGITVGEVSNEADLLLWAAKPLKNCVLAGAGDFFIALLQQRYTPQKQAADDFQQPFLYVCGTTYSRSVEVVQAIAKAKNVVVYIDGSLFNASLVIDPAWLNRCGDIILANQQLVLAFDQDTMPANVSASFLRQLMAAAVKAIVAKNGVRELLIEGGSTANAVLEALDITVIHPVNEWMRGVVRMQSDQLYITVKPGSYALPDKIITLFTS